MLIFRYLSKEILQVMTAVSIALLLITMSSRFVKYLAQAAAGDLATDVLFSIMLFRIPGFLELIIPLALFIGILLAYGRLYVESEMVVLSACGISNRRLLGYTMVVAGFVALLVASLSFYISPTGAAKVHSIFNDPKTYGQVNTLVEGRFQSSDGGKRVTYAESIDAEATEMNNIFISESSSDRGSSAISVVVADRGEIVRKQGNRYLQLEDGYRFSGQPGEQVLEVTRFSAYGQLLQEPQDLARKQLKVEARPTSELLGSDDQRDRAALLWRISLPLLVPIVALIALSLSRTDHRRGRYVKLLPAIMIYLTYLLLLSAARSGLEDPDSSFPLSIWGIHALFLLLGLTLFNSAAIGTFIRSKMTGKKVVQHATAE
ncbi:MAG: LPS export ABC transporter permease LptF [Pseudomonadales bacterium]